MVYSYRDCELILCPSRLETTSSGPQEVEDRTTLSEVESPLRHALLVSLLGGQRVGHSTSLGGNVVGQWSGRCFGTFRSRGGYNSSDHRLLLGAWGGKTVCVVRVW